MNGNKQNKPDFKQMKPKGTVFWIISFFIIFILWNMMSDLNPGVKKISFSQFMEKVENPGDDGIRTAKISGNAVTGEYVDKTKYKTAIPVNYPDLYGKLLKKNVIVEVEDLTKNEWLSWILSMAPFLILIAIWFFMMRQQGGGKAFTFGKSKAKMFSSNDKQKVTFKDVAGVKEAKEELEEIIAFLKEPKKFQRLGGKIPKGVLLIGAPGTGKTLLAKAIAGEADVPFFSISGSDFVELFVGVGASRVRDLFDEGKKHAPCLIFIDEIDAVGRQRGAGLGGGHDEREQTLNQLLVEMDGFAVNEGIIIIAATNRPDILDTALLRPGRFDRRVIVSHPDVKGREQILKVHVRKVPIAKNVKLDVLARSTPGFTGADLANMINEAALYASRRGAKKVEMKDMEYAKDKVMMGTERRSMIISDKEKKITAYHEAGHALVASIEEESDPLHKVSIIPRGMALGVTQQLPLNDKYTYSKPYLEAQLTVLLGGRLAEEIFLKEQTSGAGNDLERATSIARKMVCEWGMSSLGTVVYSKKDDMIFLGKDMMSHSEYSEDTAKKIDIEIKRIMDNAYEKTKKIITEHKDSLEKIAQLLLEKESLSSEEIDEILGDNANGRKKEGLSGTIKQEVKKKVRKKKTKKEES